LKQQIIEIIEAGLSAVDDAEGFLEPSPSFSDVATWVAHVDGREYDQLYVLLLCDGERAELVVQGGLDGTAMFFAIHESETWYLRIDPERLDVEEDAQTMITSGGTGIDALVRSLVPIDTAARALWYWLLTGECDPGLTWETLSEVEADL